MRLLAVTLIIAALAVAHAADWAVLVAGSNGFWNYRHQSDVCHAYQILKRNGIPDSQIITMYYDDIAKDSENPFPGQIFNKPGVGVDVYAGCKKDYTGDAVNSKNFLNVITGNAAAMKGVGSGKVLQSTASDRVFINFVDHGAPGLIAFPNDELYANDLITALQTMHSKNMYKQLVFYLEACESGSMFEGLLPSNMSIYATTAANSDESSYAAYCSPDDVVNGQSIGSCLGDLYSVNWMENADANPQTETLEAQFQEVLTKTTQSHVQRFGDLSFTNEPIGFFQGNLPGGQARVASPAAPAASSRATINSRDAKLHFLYNKYLRLSQGQETQAVHSAAKALEAEVTHRSHVDETFVKITKLIAGEDRAHQLMTARHPTPYNCGTCCVEANNAYRAHCGEWSDYARKYHKTLANLCISSESDLTRQIVSTIKHVCQGTVESQ